MLDQASDSISSPPKQYSLWFQKTLIFVFNWSSTKWSDSHCKWPLKSILAYVLVGFDTAVSAFQNPVKYIPLENMKGCHKRSGLVLVFETQYPAASTEYLFIEQLTHVFVVVRPTDHSKRTESNKDDGYRLWQGSA